MIITDGYKQNQGDHNLFIKHCFRRVMALLVYVDNIIVIGNDEKERDSLKKC